jgi:threonine dehydratase
VTVSDDSAVNAMRALATGDAGDVPVVSGESGAAGLAALNVLRGDAEARRQAGLDSGSRVLLLNTEGATAPALFQALTGLQADDVRSAQARWHA